MVHLRCSTTQWVGIVSTLLAVVLPTPALGETFCWSNPQNNTLYGPFEKIVADLQRCADPADEGGGEGEGEEDGEEEIEVRLVVTESDCARVPGSPGEEDLGLVLLETCAKRILADDACSTNRFGTEQLGWGAKGGCYCCGESIGGYNGHKDIFQLVGFVPGKTYEEPEDMPSEALCVCKAAWEFEGGSYAGCTTTPDKSVPDDDTWCYTTMECEGATESSVVPGTYWILCDPTDGPSTTGYHHHTTGVPTATEETGGPGTGETAGTSSVASVALSSVAVAAIAWM